MPVYWLGLLGDPALRRPAGDCFLRWAAARLRRSSCRRPRLPSIRRRASCASPAPPCSTCCTRIIIRMARAKGLSEAKVLIKHALRNASIPIVTIIGLQFGGLLGGAVITETVFAWPGVGRLAVNAVQQRDFPVVQAVTRRHRVRLLADQPDGRSSLRAPQSPHPARVRRVTWLFRHLDAKGTIGLTILALVAPLRARRHHGSRQSTRTRRTCSIAIAPPAMSGGTPEHWLGTDRLGQDVLSRIIYGSRVSLIAAFAAVAGSAAHRHGARARRRLFRRRRRDRRHAARRHRSRDPVHPARACLHDRLRSEPRST